MIQCNVALYSTMKGRFEEETIHLSYGDFHNETSDLCNMRMWRNGRLIRQVLIDWTDPPHRPMYRTRTYLR